MGDHDTTRGTGHPIPARGQSGWYNFFVTVDQEALVSVLNVKNDPDETGFVRLVEAGWVPEVLDEE